MQSATDHQYHAVSFRFVGIVREFPTAPKDSFLVANASYVAEKTASPASEIALMRVNGDPAAAAAAAARVAAALPGVKVTMAEQEIRFDDGAAYERMMGIWSRIAGDVFLDWLAPG